MASAMHLLLLVTVNFKVRAVVSAYLYHPSQKKSDTQIRRNIRFTELTDSSSNNSLLPH